MRYNTLRHGRLLAALLGLILLSSPLAASTTEPVLTLKTAIQRALQHNPKLDAWKWRFKRLDGQAQTAALSPGMQLGLEVENVLGSGDYNADDAAEYTLSLSSVLQLSGQQDARMALADTQRARAEAQQRAAALDVIGQVTRRYITLVTLVQQETLAASAILQAEKTLTYAQQRVNAGAASNAEKLRAKAALELAKLHADQLSAQRKAARLALASLWQSPNATFPSIKASLTLPAPAPDFAQLYRRVTQSPAIQVLAQKTRVRQAEVELARSRTGWQLDWSVGISHFQENGDSALNAGVSIPLFASSRQAGEVKAALASQSLAQQQQTSRLLALRVSLYQAWAQYRSNRQRAQQLASNIVPRLEKAFRLTRKGYQRGALSYSDYTSSWQSLLNARRQQLTATRDALLNQAFIESLTGTAFNAARHP